MLCNAEVEESEIVAENNEVETAMKSLLKVRSVFEKMD